MNPDQIKQAKPENQILDIITRRWSPYRYAPKPVENDKLEQCLTAASWAASSFNEQPWIFFVARRDQTAQFERMLGCLVEANQAWAKNAGALLLTAYRPNFSKNGKSNRVALHDLGQAAAYFVLQAAALGLHAHQMSGVDLDAVRKTYSIPEEYEPATAIAVGYVDVSEPKPDDQMAQRDLTPRNRLPLSEFVFTEPYQK
jgi:nitroreductase